MLGDLEALSQRHVHAFRELWTLDDGHDLGLRLRWACNKDRLVRVRAEPVDDR